MSGLALATNSAAFEQRVRRAYAGHLNGELRRWRGVIDPADVHGVVLDLSSGGTDVVTLGPDMPLAAALAVAREFDETHPEISVVIVTEPSPTMWEEALRSGVRDVVPTDASDEELRVALERAMETTDRRRRNLTDGGNGPGPAGRVITVVAPKGGSGKTAIATNLGVGLARAVPGKVALVDLDLQFGDVTQALDLKPEHTIGDVLRSPRGIDSTALKVFLTKRSDDLFVLCAPTSPDDGEQVGEPVVHRAVELLAEEFRYVVIDTAAGLTEHTLALIELSTDLILVCDMSVAAVQAMSKVIGALDRLGMEHAQRHFVLNRADSKVGLELTEVAASLGHSIDLKLPSSRGVAMSMNEGVPLIESAPRSPYSRRITDLVHALAPEHAPHPGRLFRRRSMHETA